MFRGRDDALPVGCLIECQVHIWLHESGAQEREVRVKDKTISEDEDLARVVHSVISNT